jgi:hypothetical protein
VGLWVVVERQHVLFGLEHELSSIWEALSKGAGQVIPTLHQHSDFLQAKHRPQSSGDHALVGLWDPPAAAGFWGNEPSSAASSSPGTFGILPW